MYVKPNVKRTGQRGLWVAVLVAALSAGCVTYYTHPTKTVTHFNEDSAFCAAQAGQAAGNHDPYGTLFAQVNERCLLGRGWRNCGASQKNCPALREEPSD